MGVNTIGCVDGGRSMDKKAKQPNHRLRTERLRRGWSQKKVAFDIDASRDMISRWETGEQTPSLYYQEKLCRLFEKTADELGFLDLTKAPAEPAQEALTRSLSQEKEGLPQLAQAIAQGILAAITELGEAQTMDKLRDR